MNANDPRLAAYRQKTKDRTLTEAEMRDVIEIMREGRVAASYTSAAAKKAKAAVDTDALLGELFE